MISPTDALLIVWGSNTKPDCRICQNQRHYHDLEGRRTAPTAIVCVETAVEELEAVEAAVVVATVDFLEPDVDIVEDV